MYYYNVSYVPPLFDDPEWVDPAWCKNATLYDWSFRYSKYSDDVNGKYYLHMLSGDACDIHCWTTGTMWSIAFPLMAFGFLGLAVQSVLLATGVWLFPTRLMGHLCQMCCNVLFYSGLIFMAYARFNFMGKLASVSTSGSSVKQTKINDTYTAWQMSDETTYVEDG